MDEPNVPTWVTDCLRIVLPALRKHFRDDMLSLGGGTILQARWNHRASTDIVLFADQQLFNSVVGTSASQLEQDLYSIAEVDSEHSWVDQNTVYCDVDGTELTLMPSSVFLNEASGFFVPSTRIKTESTSTILHKKVAARLIGAGACEIRDIFDLYTAISKDPEALLEAIGPIPQRSLDRASATMKSRPASWYEDTTKPLVGVEKLPDLSEMIDEVADVFGFR